MSESQERLARNQSYFREINERTQQIAGPDGQIEFVCECSHPDCLAKVGLTVFEYERIRGNATWFFVKPGHEITEIECVVSQDDGYVVVEKLVARDYAEEADVRSEGTS
jgi:hypothetical protein